MKITAEVAIVIKMLGCRKRYLEILNPRKEVATCLASNHEFGLFAFPASGSDYG